MTRSLLLLIALAAFHLSFAQSDKPCTSGSPIAPVLTVGTTCSYTNGTTAGANAQTNNANGGSPSCGLMGPDVWYQFVAPASGAVVISTQAGTITDGTMSLYSGSCANFTEIACNDNGAGMPQITASSLTPGQTYFVRFWEWGGGTGTFNICITSTTGATTTNTNCAQPTPICSGTPINFTANTGGTPASTVNPGNDYGCLFTSPNPSWYYLQIATGGHLVVDINAGSDVDFAIWGPYTSLATATGACNSYPTPSDCSYSIAATEQVNITGVTAGQVYVLLVTNYANTVQNITVNNAGGTATTNCAIVLPVGITAWNGEDAENGVSLAWTTESEQNNQYFAVQRMSSGLFWETIGVVPGNGTTETAEDYRFLDNSAAIGLNYYRLMQVDMDGAQRFTSPISVSHKGPTSFEVYPNPSQGTFAISSETVSEVHLFDLTGKEIPVAVTYNSSSVSVDASGIANGVYNLQVVESGMKKTQRIAISHK